VACAVSYAIQNDWGSGATVNVTIANNGSSAINGWTLTWTFPGNQQITQLWSGSYTQSGASVSVTNLSYNGTIPASGGTVGFGFNLSYSGTNAKPTGFSLNGTACQVQ
jgi:cellulase/cellobiase CelA1